MSPKVLFLVGFFFLVLGVVLPFLMVIRVLESTFFMNFFSYTISLVGLVLGMIAVSRYGQNNRK